MACSASSRVMVPCDAWFEWQKLESGKQPWWIHMADEQDFAFAGLWGRWEGQGKVIESYPIILIGAYEAVRKIHDRMPVILDPTDYGHWLDPEVNDASLVKPLLRPYNTSKSTDRKRTFV